VTATLCGTAIYDQARLLSHLRQPHSSDCPSFLHFAGRHGLESDVKRSGFLGSSPGHFEQNARSVKLWPFRTASRSLGQFRARQQSQNPVYGKSLCLITLDLAWAFVLSQVPPRTLHLVGSLRQLAALGRVAPGHFSIRTDFPSAAITGNAAVETDGKAADEVRAIWGYVQSMLEGTRDEPEG
jgi:hypothetical protein